MYYDDYKYFFICAEKMHLTRTIKKTKIYKITHFNVSYDFPLKDEFSSNLSDIEYLDVN